MVPALALAGSLSFAAAEDSGSVPEAELAPITVSAFGGLAVPYDHTGVSVSVLDLPELRQQGIISLNEALTTVPGVAVQPEGLNQRGNIGNIALRGMSSGQLTLPMMDGMRLYCFSNGANITPNVVGRTGLFSLGRVEVLRGAQGAVYGPGAVGGVLYMETPEGQGEPSLTLFNEGGSFDSYTGNAVAQGRVENLAYYVSASHERTNNDIAFADGRPVASKHAGHYAAWNEALRLDYDVNADTRATFTWRREDADYHYLSPDGGWGSYPSLYSFRSNLLTARLDTKVTTCYATTVMAGYYGVDNMLGHGYNLNLRNVQLEWRNLYRWCEHHSTTAGLSWNRSDYRCLSEYAGSALDNTLDNTFGFFAEHRYSPTENWDSSLALRWDQSSVWDGLFSFRAAGSYRFNQERSRVFASLGSGYKTPSALQRGGLYDAGYTRYRGNSRLDCEQSLSADIGLEQQLADDHTLSITLFRARVENGIAALPLGEETTWVNESGHRTSQGVELVVRGTLEEGCKTGYHLAWTYTQPHNERGRQIAQTARQQWSAELHTSPAEKFTTGIGLTASVGRNDYNAIRLDHYYCLRWFARYEWSETLSLHLRVENLTGQKFISESNGLADQEGSILNSGPAVYGGCTLTF